MFLGLISFNILANLIKNKTYFKMKKMNKYLLFCLSVLTIGSVAGQEKMEYRRSSLNMILLESESFPKKEIVVGAYNSHPFPDKYNEHSIDDKKFEISKVILTDADIVAAGFYKDTLKGEMKISLAAIKAEKMKQTLRFLNADSSSAVIVPNEFQLVPAKIGKFIEEKQLAKQLVATWFNRDDKGEMNYKLILERGMYSASEEKKDQAESAALESDALFDMELLGNTFVVFNRLKFQENEPVANALRIAVKLAAEQKLAGKPPVFLEKAYEAADLAYEKAKEGYTVFATSYLYKLDWNEDVANKFEEYFFNKDVDAQAAWDTTSLFKMKFVGSEKSSSLVTFSLKETRTEEEIIKLAVDRNVDKVFAKLQKKYQVFRPVTPILSVGPLTAQIGMKEGLEPGQTYEILESRTDPKTRRVKYVSVGKVKVDKKLSVWDNRIGAEFEKLLDENGIELPKKETPKYTTFTGGKKANKDRQVLRLLK